MSKSRILYLDVVKVIAITLVCIGHAPILVTLSHDSVLHDWIYSFHMPLFMLVSGFFSYGSLNKIPCWKLIIKKAKQLIIPALFVSFLRDGLSIAVTCGRVSSYDLWMNMLVGLWFLRTLFACYAYVAIAKTFHASDSRLCILSIALVFLFPHAYTLDFRWLLPFFWLGYFMHKRYSRLEHKRLIITISATIIFIFFGRHLPHEVLTGNLLLHHPDIVLWQYLTALSGSLAIISITYYAVKFFGGGHVVQKNSRYRNSYTWHLCTTDINFRSSAQEYSPY